MQLNSSVALLLLVQVAMSTSQASSQTESIMELYKKISETGSLLDGLPLNDQAQMKLKTINTIRLVSLNSISRNPIRLAFFNISLGRVQANEEVKLIELRLKLTDKKKDFHRRKVVFVLRNALSKQQIHPSMIATEQSEYLSYDLTDDLFHNASPQSLIIRRQPWLLSRLQEASLIIYSRVPGVFLLPSPRLRSKRAIQSIKVPSGPCSKHDFFVDFEQLSFGAWVVEPKRFNAGLCRGDCPNPLSRSFYPTNHAMLLSLLHESGRTNQQPSCVPVRLRPLDLLYYDRRELVIKRHQGMQVEECGCRWHSAIFFSHCWINCKRRSRMLAVDLSVSRPISHPWVHCYFTWTRKINFACRREISV